MAKGSAIIGKIKGSAGNLTFQVLKGQQIIKAKQGPRAAGTLPTYNQAWQYMSFKWASLMGNLTKQLTDHSFTKRANKESSLNKFVAMNVKNFNPVNKGITTIYDKSLELPLTMNRFMISNGSLNDVAFKPADIQTVGGSAAERAVALSFLKLAKAPASVTNLNELIQSTEFLQAVTDYLQSKNVTAGEMITAVFFVSTQDTDKFTFNGKTLYYPRAMYYMRMKFDSDGTTVIVEPSANMFSDVTNINVAGKEVEFKLSSVAEEDFTISGMTFIRSRQYSGGWECSNSFVEISGEGAGFAPQFVWNKSNETLFQQGWSTRELPILDPASLTSADADAGANVPGGDDPGMQE